MSGTVAGRAGAILRGTAALVEGERAATHGEAGICFATAADLFSDYLEARLGAPVDLRGADVARLLALLKIARAAHGAHPDHDRDLAGYAALAGALDEGRG